MAIFPASNNFTRRFFLKVVDVLINAGSVITESNRYIAQVGDTFEVVVELRVSKDGSLENVNQNYEIIMLGIFGSPPQVAPVSLVAGVATITIDTTTPCVCEIVEAGINYPIEDPTEFIDFEAPNTDTVLQLVVKP